VDPLNHKSAPSDSNTNKTSQHALNIVKIVTLIIGVIAGIVGYFLMWEIEKEARKTEIIRSVLDEKLVWYTKVNQSVMSLRKTLTLIQLHCQNGDAPTQQEQDMQRFSSVYNVANAFTGIEYIFDRDVYQKLIDLTAFEESILDVCSSEAPSDEVWRQKLREINTLMGQSISKDRKQLGLLTNNLPT
jgi:hypothetical protein